MATVPLTPPSAAARAAEPVNEVMWEWSLASTLTLAAWIPVAPSPSMEACTWDATRLSVLAPAPARPIATTPAEIATEPATTVAAIVWVASAVMVSAPSASMAVPVADAVICAGVAVVASSAQPIRLRARDAPIARPAPTKPAPRAAETAPTVAVMVASSVAEIVTALLLDSEPPDAEATVAVRMTLATSAPAPLTPAPTSPPPTASDAAAMAHMIVRKRAQANWA